MKRVGAPRGLTMSASSPDFALFKRPWNHTDVILGTGCYEWRGAIGADGYGLIQMGRRASTGNRMPSYVHVVAYEEYVGPVPAGRELDHTCGVRRCWNTDHLEPVTHADNCRRGNGIVASYALSTTCPRGHLKTPENTYERPDGKGSMCRPCQRLRADHYRKANEARPRGEQGAPDRAF